MLLCIPVIFILTGLLLHRRMAAYVHAADRNLDMHGNTALFVEDDFLCINCGASGNGLSLRIYIGARFPVMATVLPGFDRINIPRLMAEIRQTNPQVMYSETDDERAQCHQRYREMRRAMH